LEEKIIEISEVNPLDLFGANDHKLNIIRGYFPKVKIVSRGNKIKAIGLHEDLLDFETKLMLLVQHILKFSELTENHIERLLFDGDTEIKKQLNEKDEILVFGNAGKIIRARTVNQRKLVKAFDKNDMVFALGPAGTGKTYTAVALAARALKNKEVKRIILTRPAVEAGENLGFLPGDLKEKLDPFLQPLYDALYDMFPGEKLNDYLDSQVIQIAPLAFMRGRT
jgi:phosphate starvation-inducible PhoH-like protein